MIATDELWRVGRAWKESLYRLAKSLRYPKNGLKGHAKMRDVNRMGFTVIKEYTAYRVHRESQKEVRHPENSALPTEGKRMSKQRLMASNCEIGILTVAKLYKDTKSAELSAHQKTNKIKRN